MTRTITAVTLVLVILSGCESERDQPVGTSAGVAQRSDRFSGGSPELVLPPATIPTGTGPSIGQWIAPHRSPPPVVNVTGPRDILLWTRSVERRELYARLTAEPDEIVQAITQIRLSQLDYDYQSTNLARDHVIQAQDLLLPRLPNATSSQELHAAVQSACRKGRNDWTVDFDTPFHGAAVRFFQRVAGDETVDRELRGDALYRLAHLADPSDKATRHFADGETHSGILKGLVKQFPKTAAAVAARKALLDSQSSSLTSEEHVERSLAFADEFEGTGPAAEELRAAAFNVMANIASDDPVARLNRIMNIQLRHAEEHPQSVRLPGSMPYGDSYRPPLVWWASGLKHFTPGMDVSAIDKQAIRYYSLEPLGSPDLISQLAGAHATQVSDWVIWCREFWDQVAQAAETTETTREEVLFGRGVYFMNIPTTTGAKPDDSITPFMTIVRESPQSQWRPKALDLLACIARREGKTNAAVEFWQTLAADHPDSELAPVAVWDSYLAATASEHDEQARRKRLSQIGQKYGENPVISFLIEVETGYSWAREGNRQNSRKYFESAIPKGKFVFPHFRDDISIGLRSYRLSFLQDLAEDRSTWWMKVVRNIVTDELERELPSTADEAIAFYELMIARFPDPSGRDPGDYRQGHFFTLINLLVGNDRSSEAYSQVTSVLDRWKQHPEMAHPEAELMLRLWKLRLEYLGLTGNAGKRPSAEEAQSALRRILQQASVDMLPAGPSDPVEQSVESLVDLNPAALDSKQIRGRTPADLLRPWYLVGPTGWVPVEFHDGSLRHFLIRPPIPTQVSANALWIPEGRFAWTPFDTGDKSDTFRDEVVKPLFAFSDLPVVKASASLSSTGDAPAVEVDTSAWYSLASSIGQFNRITFYDAKRTRVCIERHPADQCFGDSTCRGLCNGGWQSTDTTDWMIWDN